jgi:hypothetical protein
MQQENAFVTTAKQDHLPSCRQPLQQEIEMFGLNRTHKYAPYGFVLSAIADSGAFERRARVRRAALAGRGPSLHQAA